VTVLDESVFGAQLERHRREIHVHCYRMVGSLDDADDLVQETLARAWRHRSSFAQRSSVRVWLYRIATNACLDFLEHSARRVVPASGRLPAPADAPWLQPYPDRLLDQLGPGSAEPETVVVAKETIELILLAAIQLLPPTQRAVLVLRDVLGWSASETAAVIESTVAGVNSALQRARTTLRTARRNGTLDAPALADDEEHALVQRYMDAHERGDPSGVIALMRDDARLSISPGGWLWHGRDAIGEALLEGMTTPGEWRMVATRANRQPAAAGYLRRPDDSTYRAHVVCVLRIGGGALEDIVAFEEPRLFPAFGLPASL
jgi:RNA polymerase sigma-70 factor (ECF subfamily)